MRLFLIIITLLVSCSTTIAAPMLPRGCRAVAVQGDTITLHSKKRTLVFIHNTTTMDLWITHPAAEQETNSNWTTKLQSDRWSALVKPAGDFVLHCIESKPGHEQQIPCAGTVGACKWKKVSLPEGSEAWVGEDLPLAELKAVVGNKGMALP